MEFLREEQQTILNFLMNSKHSVAVEAPTGIGKTVAYLAYASQVDGKIIISTFRKNLQHQIVKDLNKFFPSIPYVILKGKGNYVCIDKLEDIYPESDHREIISSCSPKKTKLWDKIKVTSQYCRKDYRCQKVSDCTYKNLLKEVTPDFNGLLPKPPLL